MADAGWPACGCYCKVRIHVEIYCLTLQLEQQPMRISPHQILPHYIWYCDGRTEEYDWGLRFAAFIIWSGTGRKRIPWKGTGVLPDSFCSPDLFGLMTRDTRKLEPRFHMQSCQHNSVVAISLQICHPPPPDSYWPPTPSPQVRTPSARLSNYWFNYFHALINFNWQVHWIVNLMKKVKGLFRSFVDVIKFAIEAEKWRQERHKTGVSVCSAIAYEYLSRRLCGHVRTNSYSGLCGRREWRCPIFVKFHTRHFTDLKPLKLFFFFFFFEWRGGELKKWKKEKKKKKKKTKKKKKKKKKKKQNKTKKEKNQRMNWSSRIRCMAQMDKLFVLERLIYEFREESLLEAL